MYKILFIILAALGLTACGKFDKSEEAVRLTIDTASMLKGRTIHADISVDNSSEAEHLKRMK